MGGSLLVLRLFLSTLCVLFLSALFFEVLLFSGDHFSSS